MTECFSVTPFDCSVTPVEVTSVPKELLIFSDSYKAGKLAELQANIIKAIRYPELFPDKLRIPQFITCWRNLIERAKQINALLGIPEDRIGVFGMLNVSVTWEQRQDSRIMMPLYLNDVSIAGTVIGSSYNDIFITQYSFKEHKLRIIGTA